MKPGKNDRRFKILITGQELKELKKFSGGMAEAFGLDRKVEKYQGKRPIDLFLKALREKTYRDFKSELEAKLEG